MSILLGTIIALGVLVTIHEFGHFWVARRCGVEVLCFSIGFGKPIFRWYDRHGTEFIIAMIPLGGYVKMLDERDEDQQISSEKLAFAYTRKTVLQRMAIVSAGPIANFILAFLLFWVVAFLGSKEPIAFVDKVEPSGIAASAGMTNGLEIIAVDGVETPSIGGVVFQLYQRLGETGNIIIETKDAQNQIKNYRLPITEWQKGVDKPHPFLGLGFTTYYPPILPKIATVTEGGAAQKAGLQAGDRLKSIDGRAMDDWLEFANIIKQSANKTMIVEFERQGELKQTQVTVGIHPKSLDVGFIGVEVVLPDWPDSMQRHIKVGMLGAVGKAARETWSLSVMTLVSVKKILKGELSPKNLSGPITIAKVAGSSVESGLTSFLKFLGLLSVSLGVFNLLPIPVLDGGHLLFLTMELVFRRPVSQRIQGMAMQIGLFIMLSIMLFAIMNDLSWL